MLPWKRLLRPLTVLLLTAAVTVADRPRHRRHRGRAAPSSGWNDYSCKPSAAHPAPSSSSTAPSPTPSTTGWASRPTWNRDYCVFSLDYGQLPGVPLFYGLGPIDKSAEQLQTFVDKVLAATGAAKADLVGHSQGGMMPRYYLKFLGGAAKVNALVGIAPDNHGTTLNGLTKLLPYFPGAEDLISTATPALADQVAGSAFLTKLNAGGDTVPGVHYTVIATKYDEVVTPYRASS
jgi:pimeloyl-ACP methyl ester carboxylesterase